MWVEETGIWRWDSVWCEELRIMLMCRHEKTWTHMRWRHWFNSGGEEIDSCICVIVIHVRRWRDWLTWGDEESLTHMYGWEDYNSCQTVRLWLRWGIERMVAEGRRRRNHGFYVDVKKPLLTWEDETLTLMMMWEEQNSGEVSQMWEGEETTFFSAWQNRTEQSKNNRVWGHDGPWCSSQVWDQLWGKMPSPF